MARTRKAESQELDDMISSIADDAAETTAQIIDGLAEATPMWGRRSRSELEKEFGETIDIKWSHHRLKNKGAFKDADAVEKDMMETLRGTNQALRATMIAGLKSADMMVHAVGRPLLKPLSRRINKLFGD